MESGFRNPEELLRNAEDFARVIKTAEKYCDVTNQLSRLLSAFFAMKSAFLIRKSFGPVDQVCLGADTNEMSEGLPVTQELRLPTREIVDREVQQLAATVGSENQEAAVVALERMKVFALCPVPAKQLLKMECLLGNVKGRARLVFLVELSLFAAEVGDFDAVRKYVAEAKTLAPNGWELYNLCIFEGVFALDAGDSDEALRLLEKSLRACQKDEQTLIGCGLRPPNFLLAQRLFRQDFRGEVLRHLVACKTVWHRSWMPMGEWISLIERGRVPDFDGSKTLNEMSLPSCRLDLQWMRVRSLDAQKGATIPDLPDKPLDEVIAAKERLLADVDRYISTKVKDTIRYLDEEPDAPPDHSSAGPPNQPD